MALLTTQELEQAAEQFDAIRRRVRQEMAAERDASGAGPIQRLLQQQPPRGQDAASAKRAEKLRRLAVLEHLF